MGIFCQQRQRSETPKRRVFVKGETRLEPAWSRDAARGKIRGVYATDDFFVERGRTGPLAKSVTFKLRKDLQPKKELE